MASHSSPDAMVEPRVLGVILAGGRSSRMGADKALLQLAGVSLLDRTRALLLAAGVDAVVVSGRPQLPGGIPDLHPHAGPPAAVLATLQWLQQHGGLDGTALLFLPVDMPLLQVDTLSSLLAAARAERGCHYEGEVFPCVMKADAGLLAWLQELFATERQSGGTRSMKAILAWLQARRLPVPAAAANGFLNANTPADWQRVQALWAGRP